jgi:hypothetical protein
MRMRWMTLVSLGFILVFGATPASAYWLAGGSGAGVGVLATLGAGDQPFTTASSTTVTVEWAQTDFQSAPLGTFSGGGYKILRYPESGGTAVTPSGECGGTISGATTTLSCQETNVPAGFWRYTIQPVLNSWTAPESVLSSPVGVAPGAPTLVTSSQAPGAGVTINWASVNGAVGYNVYRRTSAGVFDYGAPLNGSSPTTGTSLTDTTSADGVTYYYVVRAVAVSADATTLESVDSAETAAVTADGISPAAVSIADPGSPLHGTVTLNGSATDAGSGIAVVRFQYTEAGGSAWADACVSAVSPYSCGFDTTSLPDGLYDLRIVATDAAGNFTNSTAVLNRRIDNTLPTVTLNDLGQYMRLIVPLTATASDGGSGLATLEIQSTPTGGSTWATICATTTSPAACLLDTTALTDGGYDLRAVATDAAGNVSISLLTNRVVDNTAPTGVDVQTVEGGGTKGRPETGDQIILTLSEPVLASTVLAGWTGAPANVTVRFTNGNPDVVTVWDSTNSTQTSIGSIESGKKYVTANVSFTGSTMTMSGNTITVTLGTPNGPTSTAAGITALKWITATALTDLTGNPIVAATVSESGAADMDY